MALPDLLNALRAQASERRAEELERGRAEAARIRAEAEVDLERRREEAVARAREEEGSVARRALARAQAEAAGAVLAARDRLLERVRSAVERRIGEAPADAAYHGVVREELSAARKRLPAGPVLVRAPAEVAALLRASLGGDEDVTLEVVADMGMGFSALAPDHGVEIDATLETRLEHSWPRLAVDILAEVEP